MELKISIKKVWYNCIINVRPINHRQFMLTSIVGYVCSKFEPWTNLFNPLNGFSHKYELDIPWANKNSTTFNRKY